MPLDDVAGNETVPPIVLSEFKIASGYIPHGVIIGNEVRFTDDDFYVLDDVIFGRSLDSPRSSPQVPTDELRQPSAARGWQISPSIYLQSKLVTASVKVWRAAVALIDDDMAEVI